MSARTMRRRRQERTARDAQLDELDEMVEGMIAAGVPPEDIPCPHCGQIRLVEPLWVWESLALDPEGRDLRLDQAVQLLRSDVAQHELVASCAACGCMHAAIGKHLHQRPITSES